MTQVMLDKVNLQGGNTALQLADSPIIFLLFSIFLITFFSRAAYHILNRREPSSDAFGHLNMIESIRRYGHKPPYRLSQFLTKGFFGYPIFIHWLLSFFDRKTVERIEPFFVALIDSIHNMFLFSASTVIFGRQMQTNQYVWVSLLASLIFVATPMLVARARIYSLTMRPVGELLFTITTFFLFEYYWTDNFMFLIGAVFACTFIFISSRFAVQALVFFNLFFTLIKGEMLFTLVISVGFFLASLFSLGHYLRVLKGHVNHLYLYARTLQFKHPSITHQTYRIERKTGSIIKRRLSDLILLVHKIPILKMMAYTPFLILWIWSLFYGYMRLDDNVFIDLSLWVLVPIVLCLLFSFRNLRFLGEPERYVHYSIFPLSVLSAYFIFNLPHCFSIAILMTFLTLMVIAYEYWLGSKDRSVDRSRLRTEDELITYLKSKGKKNILPIPQVLGKRIAYLTCHKVLSTCGNLGTTGEAREEFDLLFPITYPMINTDLERIVNLYGIDLIVVEKKSIDYYGFHGKYDFSKFSKDFENDSYVIYKTKEDVHSHRISHSEKA